MPIIINLHPGPDHKTVNITNVTRPIYRVLDPSHLFDFFERKFLFYGFSAYKFLQRNNVIIILKKLATCTRHMDTKHMSQSPPEARDFMVAV